MIDKFRVSRLLMATSLIAALVAVIVLAAVAHARPESGPTAPQTAQQSTTLFVPIAFAGRPTVWSPDSIFGVQMYNETRPNSLHHASLMASGATWLRVAVQWTLVEPENVPVAEFNWTYPDQVFAAGAETAGGLRVIGTIETAPEWAVIDANKPDGPLNAENLPDFVEFVAALVERYDGDGVDDAPGSPIVNYWEIYNEPDRRINTTDGRWGKHPTEYAAMLAAVYPVIKSQNPNAQVLLGGLAYDWFEEEAGVFVRSFLDDVLAAGGGDHFDIFNFHAYPAFAHNWLPPGVTDGGVALLQKAEYLRAKLATYGLDDKPVFITEAGWHSNNAPNAPGNEEMQARYLPQLFIQSLAADADVMIWWMLYDPGGGWHNGLTTNDNPPRPKLAFTAYQTIVNQLTGREFVRALSHAETGNTAMEAYELTSHVTGAAFYTAWLNPVETEATAMLSLPGETAGITDMFGALGGTITDAADGADDGIIHVPVSGRTIYIEVTP